jgi:hypothetical protein
VPVREFDDALERRDSMRVGREVACKVLVDGRCHWGTVRDFSTSGLFVETRAVLPREADAVVSFRTPEGTRFMLEVSITRQPTTPLSLASLASGGVALRVKDAPAAYLAWVDGASAG